jgi:hypothetical protein
MLSYSRTQFYKFYWGQVQLSCGVAIQVPLFFAFPLKGGKDWSCRYFKHHYHFDLIGFLLF